MAETVRLDEHGKEEMFDAARRLNPAITEDQFDRDWAEFQAEKQRRNLNG